MSIQTVERGRVRSIEHAADDASMSGLLSPQLCAPSIRDD